MVAARDRPAQRGGRRRHPRSQQLHLRRDARARDLAPGAGLRAAEPGQAALRRQGPRRAPALAAGREPLLEDLGGAVAAREMDLVRAGTVGLLVEVDEEVRVQCVAAVSLAVESG